jgi:hypothetical protein
VLLFATSETIEQSPRRRRRDVVERLLLLLLRDANGDDDADGAKRKTHGVLRNEDHVSPSSSPFPTIEPDDDDDAAAVEEEPSRP